MTQHARRGAALLICLVTALSVSSLFRPRAASAQYLYVDTNGDGASSAADVIDPSGPTTLDVWIRTDRNGDGSAAACASTDGDLTISGYQVVLTATNGSVTWGTPVNQRSEFPSDFGTTSDGSEITIGFGGGSALPAGDYRLCSVTVSVGTGTPAVGFAAESTLSPGLQTLFYSSCSGSDLDNAIKLGVDFTDADGAPYGGAANQPPVFEPISDATVPEGTTLDVPVVATDADGDPLTYALVSGPAYASMTSGSGSASVRFAPGFADSGSASVTVRASDAFASTSATFGVVVPNVNRPPVLIPPTDMNAAEGFVNQMGIEADDPDGDAMTFYVASGPSFVTVATTGSELGTAHGLLTSTPGYFDAGMYTITAGVRDYSLSDEKDYTLMVRNTDRPPVLNAPASVQVDEGGRADFIAHATDPDYEIPGLTAAGLPGDATFTDNMDGTATFHWRPLYDAAGDYAVTVTADDRAGLTVSATTSIHVGVNVDPLALAQPEDMSIVAGHAASQILYAIDANGDPVTFALDAGPSFASVSPLGPTGGMARAGFDVSAPANAGNTTYLVTVSATAGGEHVARIFAIHVIDPATLPGQTPFAPPFRTVGTGLTPHTVTIADMDRDGIPDLVTSNLGSNSVSTYHGFGDLTFDVRRDWATAANPHTVVVSDLNGDGIPDLAMSQMGAKEVGSRLGMAGGGYAPIEQCAMDGSPMYLGVAEFDGDGIPDAVATDLTNGALEVFHGNGDGTFTRVHTYPTGAAAHGLVIGDLNRDGNQDVVVANPGPGTVTVLLGHGDGTFTPKPDFSTSAPHTLNLGDLDGDGILDLLVVNFDSGTVTILRGVGDGAFVDPQEIPTGANAHGGAIADVDGDGRPDVLVANQTAGTLSVLMNRGGMKF
ncbi:MAG: FG-GAP-like repeat-containing protein, partial [Hyphomicrobiales bacterium]